MIFGAENMKKFKSLTIKIPEAMLEAVDKIMENKPKCYASRSELIREAISKIIVRELLNGEDNI